MKSDFMVKTAKIIAEIRTRTFIDKIDAKFIEEILHDELIKYHNEVFTCGHNIGYDDGYTDGHKAGLDDAADNAYDEGYVLGYALGYDEGRSEV